MRGDTKALCLAVSRVAQSYSAAVRAVSSVLLLLCVPFSLRYACVYNSGTEIWLAVLLTTLGGREGGSGGQGEGGRGRGWRPSGERI